MPFCGSDLAPPVSGVRTVPRRWLLDPLGITFTFFLVNGALDLSTTELALFIGDGSLNLSTLESKFSESEQLDMLTEVRPGRAVATDATEAVVPLGAFAAL